MKQNKKSESISIKKFLRIYYGIADTNLLNSNITHKALKILIPDLKRLPFDYAFKNENMLASGEILLVMDCKGIVIPYKSPEAEYDIDECDEIDIEKIDYDDKFEEIVEKEQLNLYELSELCKKYKKDHRIKEYRLTYRILRAKKQKKAKTKKYRMRGYKNEEY